MVGCGMPENSEKKLSLPIWPYPISSTIVFLAQWFCNISIASVEPIAQTKIPKVQKVPRPFERCSQSAPNLIARDVDFKMTKKKRILRKPNETREQNINRQLAERAVQKEIEASEARKPIIMRRETWTGLRKSNSLNDVGLPIEKIPFAKVTSVSKI